MPNKLLIASLLILMLLTSGCASAPRPLPVAVECPPLPAPPAWMLEKVEPTFTRRTLQLLSE